MKIYLTIIGFFLTQLTFAQNPQFSELLNYYNTEKQFNGVVLVATNGEIDFLSSTGIGNQQAAVILVNHSIIVQEPF